MSTGGEILDLDVALGEDDETSLRVKLDGVVYETPAGLSAKVMLRVLRAQRDGADEMPPEFVLDMLDAVWGDSFDALLDTGIGLARLMAATGKLIGEQTASAVNDWGADDDDVDSGKAAMQVVKGA